MYLIWWAIWFVLLGWIIFAPSSSSSHEIDGDDPFTMLKIRFAKGAINKEEYEKSRKILENRIID